jgi:hypothetical protein
MSPPPTSIDGTDITGATIDGQDVQEITVDGQTVFSAGTLPLQYGNLIAWYPFDSSFYGGSNADDCTALFKPAESGDSTPYDGTVTGATYQAAGGVTDVNAGPNSGAFDFDGSDDEIITTQLSLSGITSMTLMCFANLDVSSGELVLVGDPDDQIGLRYVDDELQSFEKINGDFDPARGNGANVSAGTYFHCAATFDTNSNEQLVFLDGSQVNSGVIDGNIPDINNPVVRIGFNRDFQRNDGRIDDVRIYNTALSQSQITTIAQNTQP